MNQKMPTPEERDKMHLEVEALMAHIFTAIVHHFPSVAPAVCVTALAGLFKTASEASGADRSEFAHICNKLLEEYNEEEVKLSE